MAVRGRISIVATIDILTSVKSKIDSLNKKYTALEVSREEQKLQIENQKRGIDSLFSAISRLEQQLSKEVVATQKRNQDLLNELKNMDTDIIQELKKFQKDATEKDKRIKEL